MYAGCRCPRCLDAVLKATMREGCDLLACRRCGGGLLGAAVGLRLLAVLKPDVAPVHEGAVAAACPVCRADMRVVLASAAGVEVDVCAKHGVWFGRDDLVPVAKAAAAALGKPVPQVVDDFAERARASRPESSRPESSRPGSSGPGSGPGSVSVPPEAPRFQRMPSPGPGPVAGAVPYYSGSGGVVDTVSDVAEVAVVVALIPVEITFGIIGGFVDLFD